MRKIFLTLMCALSLNAMAQGIIVHETNNNQTTYKSADVERIEFSSEVTESTSASYATKEDIKALQDEIESLKNLIASLHPDKPDTKHEYVDLGLTVKWATCNVGANSPEEYGDYFAWGETEPYYTEGHAQDDPCNYWKDGKSAGYGWSSYKWCNGTSYSITKYCGSSYNGTVDNKTVLDLNDDAAHANWGGNWRMPTKVEQDELRNRCSWKWTSQGGVNGYVVTGPNGNSIFLPAAGGRCDSSLYYAGNWGCYWLCSLGVGGSTDAYYLYFGSGHVNWDSSYRCYGFSVRPVCP